MDHLRVGDVAQATGKTVRTLHYYEELGLIHPCQRTEGGFRLYSPDTPQRVEFISRLKGLGFSLEQVAQVIKAWDESPQNGDAADRLRVILERALAEVRSRIGTMGELERQIESSLRTLDHPDPRPTVTVPLTRSVHG